MNLWNVGSKVGPSFGQDWAVDYTMHGVTFFPFSTMSRNIGKTLCFVKKRRHETDASKRILTKPAFRDARGVWTYETWVSFIGARPAREGPESAKK